MITKMNNQNITEIASTWRLKPAADFGYRPRNGEFELLKRLVERGQPALLAGPTGCGKTTAVQTLVKPMITVIGGTLKSPQDLLGRLVLKQGESQFIPGPLLVAMDKGLMLYLDEVHDAQPEALSVLKAVTDHRRCIEMNGEPKMAHPAFCVVASGVPPFRNLSPELRQRFTFVPFDYLQATDEARLIEGLSGVDRDTADFLVEVGHSTRNSLKSIGCAGASTRALLQAAEGIASLDWSRDEAVDQLLWKLAEPDSHGEMLQVLIAAGLYSKPTAAAAAKSCRDPAALKRLLADEGRSSLS